MTSRRCFGLGLLVQLSLASCAKDYDRFTFTDDTTSSGIGGCNEPADCPAELCCLVPDGASYDSGCQAACAAGELQLCDPQAIDDCNGGACDPVADLPPGFNACE